MGLDRDQAATLLESLVSLSRTTRIIAHRDAEKSVSGTPIALLHFVRDADPRLGDLAEKLQVKPSVASRAVAALESDGLVVRVPDPDDARACRVHLTDTGRAHLQRRQDRALDLVSQAFADWSTEDAAQSVRLLQRLEESVVTWVNQMRLADDKGIDPLAAPDIRPTTPPADGVPPDDSEIPASTSRTALEKTTA
ncbi:MarR family winged helix-turn-helix transcriptional regulator [Microlunatus soli]|uniref:DNA-binding transcriptional regulator, MarR family n=1 Tax=Microlunatus soli TaxID=630515 RepID=A0A1H2AK31_9ACTN|nr:MarR family transcriptional regulator [Microlunatus soli]SDT46197.1 DNA-binding transcriptional regulator, MarR family [Microlunatus soli]